MSRETKKRANFVRFLSYVKPYVWFIVLASIGGIIKFTIPLIIPQITKYLLDDVFLNSKYATAQQLNILFRTIGLMALGYVFIWAPATYARSYFAGVAGYKAVFDLRQKLYEHILRMSASFFDRHRSGSIVSRLISDVALMQNLVGNALTNVWMDSAAIVVVLFFLFRINVSITLVALATFPIYIIVFRRFQGKIRAATHEIQEGTSQLAGNAQEKISGSHVVHAFNQERREGRYFKRDSGELLTATVRLLNFRGANAALTGILTQGAPLLVLLYGGYLVINGHLTIGELVAVNLYLSPLYLPLERFSELNVILSNSLAALDRVFEVMDENPDIQDAPEATDLQNAKGRVRFEHVHFSYSQEDDSPLAVLRDINFTVEPGQKVALVGPSGSGKSSLISLIPRFYDVTEGSIQVDGQDVRNLKVKSLRSHISIVLQTPVLFSGSVRQNILYGKPSASEEELIAAAKAANAYDFIENLPKGFDSEVGEGGGFLSGGQRQRVTIARAFLKDPQILILDEATSALDSASEKLIQGALEKLMENRTTFIVAHRLSTIINADMILVMREGRIVDAGTHSQLLKREGLYQDLYRNLA
ncbi:MAG: ABC transporter ATP-binding protein [Trueperaceae bacterium]|nr:ABC transporter ATP-binding protein [Trueperaceae bacterium]